MRASHGIAEDSEPGVLGHPAERAAQSIIGHRIRCSVQGLAAERLGLEHVSDDALAARDVLAKAGSKVHICVLWAESLGVNCEDSD